MRIGLVPGSFKPYHKGHDEMIRLAAEENDLVLVFSSTADREEIDGRIMTNIINKFVKPTLPSNVRLLNVGVPVGALFQELEYAEENEANDFYTIYSDVVDIRKYSAKTLAKYAPKLLAKKQLNTRGIQRGVETTNVSGTEMRRYLAAGDVKNFSNLLPVSIQRHAPQIIKMLKSNIRESLVRVLIKEILRECR